MWSFRRKKTVQKINEVPTEVQDYYQAERRDRVGIAWLLGIATLIVTILLAIILFFGGRWLYRKVTKDDKPVSTTAPSTTKQAPATTGSENQSSNSQNSSESSGSSSSNPPSSSASNTPSNSTTNPSTPTTSPAPLPRTGPDPADPNHDL